MPTLHTRRFVYVGAVAGPVAAPANALLQAQQQQHHHAHAGLHAFLSQPSQLAPTSYKSPPGNPVLPPRFGTESTLGPQAGPTREVLGYLAAWRKHCKKLRKVQFVKDYMWKRLDEELPWVGVVVDEENAIKFIQGYI